MNTSAIKLDHLIEGFRLSCLAQGLSPKTIEWYTANLARFLRFITEKGIPTAVSHITRDHLRGFIRYLQAEVRVPRLNTPLSPAAIQGYVRTLKVFPRAPAKAVAAFTQDQVGALLQACQAAGDNSRRDVALLLLMLDCGLRVSEVVGIALDDLDLSSGSVRIRHAKGGKERTVPIGSTVQRHLWRYTGQDRPQPLAATVDSLFLTANGLPLTKTGVQQMVRRLGRRAGITGVRCSPHVFRHTFAKNYLMNGGDVFSLQRILGHSDLSTVRLYLNLFSCDLKAQHNRFSPVDNLAASRIAPVVRSRRPPTNRSQQP